MIPAASGQGQVTQPLQPWPGCADSPISTAQHGKKEGIPCFHKFSLMEFTSVVLVQTVVMFKLSFEYLNKSIE